MILSEFEWKGLVGICFKSLLFLCLLSLTLGPVLGGENSNKLISFCLVSCEIQCQCLNVNSQHGKSTLYSGISLF